MKMHFKTKFSMKDKNLAKIFTFFVVETPVSNISYRSVTFKERNINMKRLTHDIKNEIEGFKAELEKTKSFMEVKLLTM